jgi:hypothetical protein
MSDADEDILREKEEALRAVLSQVPLVLWTTDRELRFTDTMGAERELLNQEPGDVRGMSLFSYFRTTDPEFEPIAAHRRALAGESVAYEATWKHRLRGSENVTPRLSHVGFLEVLVEGAVVDTGSDLLPSSGPRSGSGATVFCPTSDVPGENARVLRRDPYPQARRPAAVTCGHPIAQGECRRPRPVSSPHRDTTLTATTPRSPPRNPLRDPP